MLPHVLVTVDGVFYLLTKLSSSWGPANCAANQEFPRILWNPKFQHRVHNIPSLVPILRHINSIHTTLSSLSKIHFNIVHPPTSEGLVALTALHPLSAKVGTNFADRRWSLAQYKRTKNHGVTRSRTVGRTPWTGDELVARPLLTAPGDCEDGEVGGMNGFGMRNRSIWRQPAPTPLCPPQIPFARTWREPGPLRWETSD
jgi:hypothetical protein